MASRASIAARLGVARDRIAKAMDRASRSEGVKVPSGLPAVPIRQPELKVAFELERVATFLDDLFPPSRGDDKPKASTDTPQGDNAPQNERETPQDEPEGDDLDALTVAELKDRAKAVHVKGYGSLSKSQLIEALRDQG